MAETVTRRAFVQAAAGLAATGGFAGHAFAQAGGKTIQFILPVSAGSGVDSIARAAQNELAKALGAPIIINNQPGAGGVIGTNQMIRSAPDGATLSMISNNHVIYPSVLKSVPFDPIADITPIALVGTTPLVLVTHPGKVAAKSLPELLALLKANPDKHHYGSSGNGTILHFAGAMFVEQAGLKVTHVPYKGVGPLVTDLIGGQIDMAVLAYPSVASHIKSGAMRAIGVGSAQRIPAAADIATFVEQGMPSYLVEGWIAVIGPAKLPAAEVERIQKAFAAAFDTEEVKASMAKGGNTIAISSPAKAAEFMKAELAKYATLAKAMKLEPQ